MTSVVSQDSWFWTKQSCAQTLSYVRRRGSGVLSNFSCHSSLIAVSGNSRKFDAKINLGAGFAPTQIAYQQKAKALESLKMETRGLCKQRPKKLRTGKHIGPLHHRLEDLWWVTVMYSPSQCLTVTLLDSLTYSDSQLLLVTHSDV